MGNDSLRVFHYTYNIIQEGGKSEEEYIIAVNNGNVFPFEKCYGDNKFRRIKDLFPFSSLGGEMHNVSVLKFRHNIYYDGEAQEFLEEKGLVGFLN